MSEETTTPKKISAEEHFLELAKRGQHGAASGGEVRAHKVAVLLRDMTEHLAGLDNDAIAGVNTLVRMASYAPHETRRVLDMVLKIKKKDWVKV